MRLFSTEQVTKYHPDKYADQISDAVLDACLNEDQNSRVACETLVKGETVVLAGEITTKANPNYAAIVNRVAKKLGYKASNIITYIDHQSPEIANGVDAGGAGDQGMMYGAAFGETEAEQMLKEFSAFYDTRGKLGIKIEPIDHSGVCYSVGATLTWEGLPMREPDDPCSLLFLELNTAIIHRMVQLGMVGDGNNGKDRNN